MLTLEELGYIPCASCGITLVNGSGKGLRPWGHSHNLPVAHYKQFESDRGNFVQRCQNWGGRQGCHEKLDEPNFYAIVKFKDFPMLVQYRLTHAPEAYNQWITKLNELGINPGYGYADIDR